MTRSRPSHVAAQAEGRVTTKSLLCRPRAGLTIIEFGNRARCRSGIRGLERFWANFERRTGSTSPKNALAHRAYLQFRILTMRCSMKRASDECQRWIPLFTSEALGQLTKRQRRLSRLFLPGCELARGEYATQYTQQQYVLCRRPALRRISLEHQRSR